MAFRNPLTTSATLADGSVTSVKLALTIQSDNFVAGSVGWRIQRGTGSAEFNDVTVRGTLIAGVSSTVPFSTITAAANTAALVVDPDGTVGSGNYVAATSGWQIDGNGNAEFNDVIVRGTVITAAVGGDIELGLDVGPGSGHAGLSLSGANFDNIFLRRTTDGVVFFRVNSGGANALLFDSTSGVLTVTGTINADAGSFSDVDISGTLTMTSAGLIRSSSSGERVEMGGTASSVDRIRWFSGIGNEDTEAQINIGTSGSGIAWVLNGPIDTTETLGFNQIHFNSKAVAAGAGIDLISIKDKIRLEGRVGGVQFVSVALAADGTGNNPSWSFANDIDSGFYRIGNNNVGLSLGGTPIYNFAPSSLSFGGSTVGNISLEIGSTSIGASTALTFIDFHTGRNNDFDVRCLVNSGSASSGNGTVTWTAGNWLVNAVYNVTTGAAANVNVISNGHLKRSTSARKYKSRINYNVAYLADYNLKPAKFYRKDDHAWYLGLIADDLANENKLIGVYDKADEIDNYDHRAVLAIIAAKINRMEKEIEQLKAAA